MTLNGTIHRAICLLFCVIAAAVWAWNGYATSGRRSLIIAILICSLAASVLVWVAVRKKQWSGIIAPGYALLEGLALGIISRGAEARHPGIAINAVAVTFVICFCLLVAYRSGLIRVTEKFNAGLAVATIGVALFYLAGLGLSLTGVRTFSVFAGAVPGILMSVVIVIIAGMTLVSDFNFIERAVRSGLPKYMEWYAALGLTVALIWLYVEILRLLSKAEKAQESGYSQ